MAESLLERLEVVPARTTDDSAVAGGRDVGSGGWAKATRILYERPDERLNPERDRGMDVLEDHLSYPFVPLETFGARRGTAPQNGVR